MGGLVGHGEDVAHEGSSWSHEHQTQGGPAEPPPRALPCPSSDYAAYFPCPRLVRLALAPCRRFDLCPYFLLALAIHLPRRFFGSFLHCLSALASFCALLCDLALRLLLPAL